VIRAERLEKDRQERMRHEIRLRNAAGEQLPPTDSSANDRARVRSVFQFAQDDTATLVDAAAQARFSISSFHDAPEDLDDVSFTARDGIEESREAERLIVPLQLVEQRERDKLMKREASDRKLLVRLSAASTGTSRRTAQQHRVIAMLELEEETRLMYVQSESEWRRRLLAGFRSA
jgi:hypothetical protein